MELSFLSGYGLLRLYLRRKEISCLESENTEPWFWGPGFWGRYRLVPRECRCTSLCEYPKMSIIQNTSADDFKLNIHLVHHTKY